MHIVGRNSKLQPLCCVTSDTILQRSDKRQKEYVWLLHAGQCHGSHIELLTDCPGRGIQEMANSSQIVVSKISRFGSMQLLFVGKLKDKFM
jgi:hypothetical protein